MFQKIRILMQQIACVCDIEEVKEIVPISIDAMWW
jgi:hypothetical protein